MITVATITLVLLFLDKFLHPVFGAIAIPFFLIGMIVVNAA